MNYKEWSLKQTCEMASGLGWSLFDVVLAVIGRQKGELAQAEYKKAIMSAHQKKYFLSGLKPLGIDPHTLPPAVVCGRYHYVSNAIMGSRMEYVEESPKKVWIRYWYGSNPARITLYTKQDIASEEAWHARNGESLHSIGVKNGLRVGIVITKLTAACDPVWEMYFKEYDHDLTPEERCKFIPDLNSPDSTHYGNAYLDMQKSGAEAEQFPEERVLRQKRAAAIYYQEDVQEAVLGLYGIAPACQLLRYCWRMIAAIKAREWKQKLGIIEEGAHGMALFMNALGEIQDDEMEMKEVSPKEFIVRKKSSRMFRGRLKEVPPQLFVAQNGFYETSAESFRYPVKGPKVRVKFLRSMAEGDPYFEWLVKEV